MSPVVASAVDWLVHVAGAAGGTAAILSVWPNRSGWRAYGGRLASAAALFVAAVVLAIVVREQLRGSQHPVPDPDSLLSWSASVAGAVVAVTLCRRADQERISRK